MSHLAYYILLAQLIATLIHYPCIVALTGLDDWSAFLEWVVRSCEVMTETMGPMEGGMGLIFTPMLVRNLLRWLRTIMASIKDAAVSQLLNITISHWFIAILSSLF